MSSTWIAEHWPGVETSQAQISQRSASRALQGRLVVNASITGVI